MSKISAIIEVGKNLLHRIPMRLIFLSLLIFSPAVLFAQEQEQAKSSEIDDEQIETVVVVGTRRQGRTLDELAVPVDIVDADAFRSQNEMIEALTSAVPSYNVAREPISDAATLVRPVNLRGLPADSTLVLVNGKRRHRGAVIGEYISSINRGAQGVDINPLSGIAIKHVEVLRDGASAQYGSDAIAGVVNFVMEDDPNARRWELQYGSTFEGDGEQARFSGVHGIQLGVDGYATVALDVRHNEPTVRSTQDPQALELVQNGFMNVADPVVKWGAPEVKDNYKLLVNAAVPAPMGEVYGFGNWATRDVDGSFFFRNPNTRQNVFVVGPGAEAQRLVADVTGNGCPEVTVGDARADDPDLVALVADPDCFVFNEWFPGGFTPRFGGIVNDRSMTFGWRGDLPEDKYLFDFSISFGRNQAIYEIHNTVNASYGPNSPTDFYLGEAIQSEQIIGLDWQTRSDIGAFSELNIAFGTQFHREKYEIVQGQNESWQRGRFYDAGFSVGSNGFQGYSRDVAGEFTRENYAAYVDLEVDLTEEWLVSTAARYEVYSDFGNTLNGKFAARYQLTENVAWRGSISTGFRAPSVGQSNLRRTSTGFSGGMLVEQVVLPPTHPISILKGGKALDSESSINVSLGVAFVLGTFDVTVDWFNVAVDNRIALTGLDLTPEDRDELLAGGVTGADTVTRVNFYVNDFDTNTSGFDVVAQTDRRLGDGIVNFSFLANMTSTEVTTSLSNSTLDAATAEEIENAVPDVRLNATVDYSVGRWFSRAGLKYYGNVFELLFTDPTLQIRTDPLVMVDAELTYQVTDTVSASAGVRNVFDTRPDEHQFAGVSGFLGADYPLNHPAGFDGGSYYTRLTVNW